MKKSLIALAVLAASGTAFAATSNVEVGGQIRISADKSNNGGKLTLADKASRLNISGTEDIGGGLKAFYHAEWNIDAADGNEGAVTSTSTSTTTPSIGTATTTTTTTSTTDSPFTTRQTYVGVQGGFGKVLMGKAYAPYKLIGSASVFEDTAADSQGDIVGTGHDSAYSQALAYISPDFANTHIAVAVTNNGTASVAATDSVSAIVAYANGPLKVSYGYESQGDKTLGGATTTTDTGSVAQKLNLGYKMGDIGMGYTYEKINNGTAHASADRKAQIASLTYGMGPVTLAAQYGKLDVDATTNGDITRTTVGAFYALSKRTNMAVAYNNNKATAASDVKTTTNTTTVQLNHSF